MSICSTIRRLLPDTKEKDAMQLSPLALAYMGDCVYDLYVRTLLIHKHDFTARNLHVHAAKLVNAGAQAQAAGRVVSFLNETELSIYKRGRNAHMGTVAKNATSADYRAATGLEAVIGYLYISGEDERIEELMEILLQMSENGERNALKGKIDD
jgi:ribonuclease-3 family protein